MAKQILLVRMSSSGYSVWRDDNLSVEARFTTIRRARAYLRGLAELNDGEVQDDQLSLEDDLYQIVQVDEESLPLDPQARDLVAA
jgi:hypothetical protein